MDEKELFERLDNEFEEYVDSYASSDSLVPYDYVDAFRLAPELEDILRQVIPGVVVEKHE